MSVSLGSYHCCRLIPCGPSVVSLFFFRKCRVVEAVLVSGLIAPTHRKRPRSSVSSLGIQNSRPTLLSKLYTSTEYMSTLIARCTLRWRLWVYCICQSHMYVSMIRSSHRRRSSCRMASCHTCHIACSVRVASLLDVFVIPQDHEAASSRTGAKHRARSDDQNEACQTRHIASSTRRA